MNKLRSKTSINNIKKWALNEKTIQIFKTVDCVVAGNDWLKDQAARYCSKAITIEVAEDVNRYPIKSVDPTSLTSIIIGWLGSPSTSKYLFEIQSVLEVIFQEYPSVTFEAMGCGNFSMSSVPWVIHDWTLESEIEFLSRIHIGLMPLPNQQWSLGKSGGKARTYMAAGVVPVVSSIGYNETLISNAVNGFLCSSQDDWYSSLKFLISNPSSLIKIRSAARQLVSERFNPITQAHLLQNLFTDLSTS